MRIRRALVVTGLACSTAALPAVASGCSAGDSEPTAASEDAVSLKGSDHENLDELAARLLALGDAGTAVDGARKELASEMYRIGPLLTDAQQKAYLASFATDVLNPLEKQRATAARALDDWSQALLAPKQISARKAKIAAAGGCADACSTAFAINEQLYQAAIALSTTSSAAHAVTFASRLAFDAAYAADLGLIGTPPTDTARQVQVDSLADIMPRAAQSTFITAVTSAASAKAVDPLASGFDATTRAMLFANANTTQTAFGQILSYTAELKKTVQKPYSLKAQAIDAAGAAGPRVGPVLQAIALAAGIYSMPNTTDGLTFMSTLLTTTEVTSGVTLASAEWALSFWARQPALMTAAAGADWYVAHVNPLIDVVVGAVSVFQDVGAVADGGNAGTRLHLLGDVVWFAGSIAVFSNPVVGAVLTGAGALVAYFGASKDDAQQRAQRDDIIRQRVQKALAVVDATINPSHLSAAQWLGIVNPVLANGDDNRIWEFSALPADNGSGGGTWKTLGRVGLAPENLQQLAADSPNCFVQTSMSGYGVRGIDDIRDAFALSPSDTMRLLTAVAQHSTTSPAPAYLADTFLAVTVLQPIGPNAQGWLDYFQALAANNADMEYMALAAWIFLSRTDPCSLLTVSADKTSYSIGANDSITLSWSSPIPVRDLMFGFDTRSVVTPYFSISMDNWRTTSGTRTDSVRALGLQPGEYLSVIQMTMPGTLRFSCTDRNGASRIVFHVTS